MGRSFNISAGPLFLRIVLWLLAFVTIIPFLLLLLTSIKSKADVLQGAFAFLSISTFRKLRRCLECRTFQHLLLEFDHRCHTRRRCKRLLGLLTGFAFAYLSFPLRRTLFAILTLGMMVLTEAFIIPLYYEMRYLGLINTYAALIVPQIAMSIPFSTIFLASAMQQLPEEVLEAAVLDGAGRFYILRKIVIPLMVLKNVDAGAVSVHMDLERVSHSVHSGQ